MKALQFELYGSSATFGSLETVGDTKFTYDHIPKTALIGLIGCILGLNGYNAAKNMQTLSGKKPKTDEVVLPEYYLALKDFKVAIKPNSTSGTFEKERHKMTNTSGIASSKQKEGRTLIYNQEWLMDVSWTITVLDNGSKEYQALKEHLVNETAVFIPYLGAASHTANFGQVQEIEVTPLSDESDSILEDTLLIDSLFPMETIEYIEPTPKNSKYYRGYLPIALDDNGRHMTQELFYSHCYIKLKPNVSDFFKINPDTVIYFL